MTATQNLSPVDPLDTIPPWSPSAFSSFTTCSWRFWIERLVRVETVTTPAQARGTFAHLVLEHFFGLPPGRRDRAALGAAVTSATTEFAADPSAHKGMSDEDRATARQVGAELASRILSFGDPNSVDVVSVEQHVVSNIGGLHVRGYIDRVDQRGERTAVVDYKSGRSPKQQYSAQRMHGVLLYSAMLETNGAAPPATAELQFLGDETVVFERLAPDNTRRVTARCVAIAAAADRALQHGPGKGWRPNPSRLCDWCEHQALCPAFLDGDVGRAVEVALSAPRRPVSSRNPRNSGA